MKILELPPEVILEIFRYTPFLQKLECMLVCRKWARMIREHVLFHTVTIWNKPIFKQYFQLIEKDSSVGSQVERLILFNCLENNFRKKYLFTLFPKTRYIHIRQLCSHGIPTPQMSNKTKEKLQSFRNHIQHVVDYNKAEFIFYLLTSGACLRLTIVEVELSRDIDIADSFAQLLENAPNISTLKIIKSLITIQTLEKIHKNLPSLESLALKDVRVLSGDIPEYIAPAITLNRLSFHDEIPWSHLENCWLQYVCRKYTNLSYLTLLVTPVDLNSWTEEETNVFTRESILPILQNVGPQLRQLKINGNTLEPSLFESMDHIGCQIDELDVNNFYQTMALYPLLKSNQCKYIQSLSLRNLMVFNFELLKELPVLKNLELFFNLYLTHDNESLDTRVDLGILLKMCPSTLKSLLIYGVELICDLNIAKHNFQIEKLVFGEPWFHDEMGEFLSKCCLNLNTIVLYDCGLNDIVLKLPNHKLSLFEVNQSRPDYLIACEVSTNDKRQFYSSDTKFPGIFNTIWGLDNVEPPELAAIKSISYEQPQFGVPFVRLECISVLNLIINRRLAC